MKENRLVFIFDIGGVLIKWPSNDPIFRFIANTFNVRFGEMKNALLENFAELEQGRITDSQWINTALCKVGKQTRRPNQSLCERLLLEPFANGANPRLGVIKFIRSLRKHGYKVYALTNTSKTHLSFMEKKGWLEYFDRTFASCEIGFIKPQPKIFEETLKGAGAKAQETVFIDDKLQNINGARDFGIVWAIKFKSISTLKKDIARIIRQSEMKN